VSAQEQFVLARERVPQVAYEDAFGELDLGEFRAVCAVDEDEAAPDRFVVEGRVERRHVRRFGLGERAESAAREGRDVRVFPVFLVGRREAQLLEALESALAQPRHPGGLAPPRLRGERLESRPVRTRLFYCL
jgi:hypothetical protein